MASRLETQARRQALTESLRRSCQDGSLPPGAMLPAVRELSERHGLSINVVFQVIQSLCEEGFVYTVPRVGAFVGRPPREEVELYLMVMPYRPTAPNDFWVQARAGFEDRVAQLGGHSLVLTTDQALEHLRQNQLPPLAGYFDGNSSSPMDLPGAGSVPRVAFGSVDEIGPQADGVSFDNFGGGAAAARHLLQEGFRSIAFLGLHCPEAGGFAWSQEREAGWRHALQQVDAATENLAFHPAGVPGITHVEQIKAAREAAAGLVGRDDIGAVVTVNDLATTGMLEHFREREWPAERWPAIVSFDEVTGSSNSIVSYFRLPWEDIGREAAQVLWERRSKRLDGAPVQRLVPMRLVARLSSRPDWAQGAGLMHPRALATG